MRHRNCRAPGKNIAFAIMLLSLLVVATHHLTRRLDCGNTLLCGVLALETGLGEGSYKHPAPTVHGLWPATGSYGTSACTAPSKSAANPKQLFSCYNSSSSRQVEFEEHEWQKHGMCAGVRDAADYFSQVCSLSRKPLATMVKSRSVGRTLSSEFASDLAAMGFPVFFNDSRHGQITLSSCADSMGTWHLASRGEFSSLCNSPSALTQILLGT